MTGEMSLLGRVLPIGGLKEKVLAAHRTSLRTVILPKDNEKDLEEVPLDVRSQMIFAPVDHIEQVLELALEDTPVEDPANVEAQRSGDDASESGPPPNEGIINETVVARGRRR
jgi:ATP-dependent Lon protease